MLDGQIAASRGQRGMRLLQSFQHEGVMREVWLLDSRPSIRTSSASAVRARWPAEPHIPTMIALGPLGPLHAVEDIWSCCIDRAFRRRSRSGWIIKPVRLIKVFRTRSELTVLISLQRVKVVCP